MNQLQLSCHLFKRFNTCGRCFQQLGRGCTSGLEVLVHQVRKHGHHIGAPPLIPVTINCQPITQVFGLLPWRQTEQHELLYSK